jgi:hypothetical protein
MDERVCIDKYWLTFAKMEINLLYNTKIAVQIYTYSEIFSNFSAFLLLRLYPFRKNGSKLNIFACLKNCYFSPKKLWVIMIFVYNVHFNFNLSFKTAIM